MKETGRTLVAAALAVAGLSPMLVKAQSVGVTVGPVGSVAVPTMSNSLMIGLGLLLAVIALRVLKQRDDAARVLSVALLGGGLLIGSLGVERSMATFSGVNTEPGGVCDGGTQEIVTGRAFDENYLENTCETTPIQIKSYQLPCSSAEQITYNGDVGTVIPAGENVRLNVCPAAPA